MIGLHFYPLVSADRGGGGSGGGGDCMTSQKNVCGGRLKQLLIRLRILV